MSDGYWVDHLYYINLDQRRDRQEHMLRQLAPCRWPFERIPTALARTPSSPVSGGDITAKLLTLTNGGQAVRGLPMDSKVPL